MLVRPVTPADHAEALAASAEKRDRKIARAHERHQTKRSAIIARVTDRIRTIEVAQRELAEERVELEKVLNS